MVPDEYFTKAHLTQNRGNTPLHLDSPGEIHLPIPCAHPIAH